MRIIASLILLYFLGIMNHLSAEAPFAHFSPAVDYPNSTDYISLLQQFPNYAERLWHDGYQGNPDIGYFSTGMHDHNHMRSLSNFIFVYALLSVSPDYHTRVSGIEQDILLDRTKSAIRYLTGTHVTGKILTTDGRKWGLTTDTASHQSNQWISPWIVSKALAGAHLIWDFLTDKEKFEIKQMVIHEANFQLGLQALTGDLKSAGGKFPALNARSEVNALNAEVLSWAFSLYPEHPNADKWKNKAQELFITKKIHFSSFFRGVLIYSFPKSWNFLG